MLRSPATTGTGVATRREVLPLVAAAAIATIVALAASTAALAAPPNGKTFKDWRIACENFKDQEGKDVSQCHMFQAIDLKNQKLDISLEREDGKSLRLLTFQVAYNPREPAQALAILTTPLGTSLRPGLAVKIDKGKELRFPFDRCLNVGCKIGLALDKKLLADLQRGSTAQVRFHDLRGKGIVLPVSLNGFTAALRALKE